MVSDRGTRKFRMYECMIKIFRGGEGVVDGEGVAVKDA